MGWDEAANSQYDVPLLGYQCTTYFRNFTHTELIAAAVTTYTIQIRSSNEDHLPLAFSVASVHIDGVVRGHTPPLIFADFGEKN